MGMRALRLRILHWCCASGKFTQGSAEFAVKDGKLR
jgi:hypothetical protein